MVLPPHLMHDTLQQQRNQFIIEREAQLSRWRADIASMEKEVGWASLSDHQDKLIDLKGEMSTVEDQLAELKEATEEAWEETKPAVEKTWEELSTTFEKFKQALR